MTTQKGKVTTAIVATENGAFVKAMDVIITYKYVSQASKSVLLFQLIIKLDLLWNILWYIELYCN